ncbi:MAG: hypothetical protein JWQ71_1279 [Pedosphaera sp.]|nr:hypothetical protein [Pedosphaera sp.]
MARAMTETIGMTTSKVSDRKIQNILSLVFGIMTRLTVEVSPQRRWWEVAGGGAVRPAGSPFIAENTFPFRTHPPITPGVFTQPRAWLGIMVFPACQGLHPSLYWWLGLWTPTKHSPKSRDLHRQSLELLFRLQQLLPPDNRPTPLDPSTAV